MGFNGISNNDKPQLMDFNVVKHRHKPPMTGKGKHTTDKNRERERGGMVYGIVLPTL
jgi:hypothetical protein